LNKPLGARMAALAVFSAVAASARPVSIPFDFSWDEVAIEATINGAPVRLLLDTGVSPSVIDTARAKSLGLGLDNTAAGDMSGTGATKQATAVPTTIRGLEIAGDSAPPFEALATDLTDFSAKYGSRLDGMLGYSFLKRRIVLIDYPARRLKLLDRPAQAQRDVSSCRQRWRIPMQFLKGDDWPLESPPRAASGPSTPYRVCFPGSTRKYASGV
jgi:hypothetical protein